MTAWTTQQLDILAKLQDVLEGTRRDPFPRLVRVEGRSHTGKSTLIMEMAHRVKRHYGGKPETVLVVATTNAAAAAVGGATFHRAFALPLDPRFAKPEDLSQFDRDRLAQVRVLIIEEANMVSKALLDQADRRLRTAVGENGLPFGGRGVFAFGDHDSWGPMDSRPGTRPNESIWSAFGALVTLEQSHVPEVSFRHALQRLADDAITDKDTELYETRLLSKLPATERQLFDDAPRVCIGKDAVLTYNNRRKVLESSRRPESAVVHEVQPSVDPYTRVELWEGAKVVITANTRAGSFAGELGEVSVLHLTSTKRLTGVSVLLESGKVVELTADANGNYPLAPAYTALTLPKALGLHFARVVVELPIGGWGGVQYLYGAVSRAREWAGLAFEGGEVPRPKGKRQWRKPAAAANPVPFMHWEYYGFGYDDEFGEDYSEGDYDEEAEEEEGEEAEEEEEVEDEEEVEEEEDLVDEEDESSEEGDVGGQKVAEKEK
ncbi:uncharacterized protein LOC117649709 [Thrips palmi]|uniref:ATP-dependent DNA helicase n=1 Tax=Thrips palmi TaxID=161013 RepID=A0A6P8ZTJ0_THRPL|nr:uncharacterized protein LOC117649709 [Thrips palmi]